MSTPATVSSTELRTRFAARLSSLYGAEVPAYTTLVEVSQEVNQRVIAREGADAERLGSIDRVTAERHGAIRVGTPGELAQVSRVFGALGMFPCGFYDLRDAAPAPVPVVSTAFRPLDRAELAANPFRVFTSMLVPEDRRFFDADLEGRLRTFLAARELFPAELLALADVAIEHGELSAADADRYLELAAASFALSADPVDRAWYQRARAHLGRGGRHRRGDDDPHQPPDAPGARHRRPVRVHAGPRHRDDRRDPGPAAVGRPGRAAAPDLVPRPRGAAHLQGRRRADLPGGAAGQVR